MKILAIVTLLSVGIVIFSLYVWVFMFNGVNLVYAVAFTISFWIGLYIFIRVIAWALEELFG